MARFKYKIVNHLVGTEVGGTGEDRLTATLEVDESNPAKIYITYLKLVRSKYSAHNARWLNQRPFGLYLILTPDSAVNTSGTNKEVELVYNHITSSQYGITSLPAVNPYSWTIGGASLPRINAIFASTDSSIYDPTSHMYEPPHIVVATRVLSDGDVYTDAPDGATATFIADTSNERLYFYLKSEYQSMNAFASLYVKFNQFTTHTSGADWWGWASTFSLKDALENAVITYNANGGQFDGNTSTYVAVKSLDGPILIRRGPDVPAGPYFVHFNVPSDVATPETQRYTKTFINWNTNAAGTGTTYTVAQSYTSNANLTLYAQWQQPVFGQLPVPTRTGYTFDGWSLTPGGTLIQPSDPLPSDSSLIQLYSNWSQTPAASIVHKYDATTGTWVAVPISSLGIWQYNSSAGQWERKLKIHRYVNGEWTDIT